MIYHKHKCIFIAVPKTGSSSICYTLEGRDNSIKKHSDILEVKKLVKKNILIHTTNLGSLEILGVESCRSTTGERVFK